MAVRSVGIDLSITGMHRAEAIDAAGQRCGHLSFGTTPEGLAALAALCFRDDSTPTIVLEPTGLVWLPIVLFLKARCPQAVVVRAKEQKVAALRRVLTEHAKSDRIDALTLARLPWVDPEHLEPLNLVSPEMQRLDRLTRRRDQLAASVGRRKTRLASYLMGVFPGLWECFEAPYNARARWTYRHCLNPFRVERMAVERIENVFRRLTPHVSLAVIQREAVALLAVSKRLAATYRPARSAGLMADASFQTWTQEISMELDLVEAEEKQMSMLEEQIDELYSLIDPQNHLHTIPGVGPHIAPLLLAAVGDIGRFHDVKSFCQWTGVLPRSHQSSRTQFLGMGMAKAGPARVKKALFQAAEYARRLDPEMAAIYFRQMVQHGKTHRQAMGAVMSHVAARVYVVLKEKRAYELRGADGRPVTRLEARIFIREHLRVPEEIRKLRRQHNRPTKKSVRRDILNMIEGRPDDASTNEAAEAPQRGDAIPMRPKPQDNTEHRVRQLVAGPS